MTLGFDFVSHAIEHYFYEGGYQQKRDIFGVSLPRYLGLTELYHISRFIGIPIGFVYLSLLFVPLWLSIKKIIEKHTVLLIDYILLILTIFISIRYSATGITFLYFVSFIVLRKKYFLLGSVLHPIGLLMFYGFFLTAPVKWSRELFVLSIISVSMLTVKFIFYNSELLPFILGGYSRFDTSNITYWSLLTYTSIMLTVIPIILVKKSILTQAFVGAVGLMLLRHVKLRLNRDILVLTTLLLSYTFIGFWGAFKDKNMFIRNVDSVLYEIIWLDFGVRNYKNEDLNFILSKRE